MIRSDNKFALFKINENLYCCIYIFVHVVIKINICFYKIYLHNIDIIKT